MTTVKKKKKKKKKNAVPNLWSPWNQDGHLNLINSKACPNEIQPGKFGKPSTGLGGMLYRQEMVTPTPGMMLNIIHKETNICKGWNKMKPTCPQQEAT